MLLLSAAAAALFAPAGAFAGDLDESFESDDTAAFASAITDEELDDQRGMFGSAPTTLMYANLTGSSEGNTAINNITGANNIDSSFNNVNGFVNVIQNSGNNTVVLNSFQVNVNFLNDLTTE